VEDLVEDPAEDLVPVLPLVLVLLPAEEPDLLPAEEPDLLPVLVEKVDLLLVEDAQDVLVWDAPRRVDHMALLLKRLLSHSVFLLGKKEANAKREVRKHLEKIESQEKIDVKYIYFQI
jgi:hypothetical protein